MVSKSLGRIVDNDGFRKIPPQNRQILDVVPVNADTMFSEQPVLDPLPFRIQQVQKFVGVDSLGRSEQDNLKHLRHLLHELFEKRPGSHIHRVRAILEEYGEVKTRIC